MTRGAVIVGASSGIGAALARQFAADGYTIGIAARRTERLNSIAEEVPSRAHVATMDVTAPQSAREQFRQLVSEMERVDVVVIAAGVGPANPGLEWNPDRKTIEVNVRGFAALATAAIDHFETRTTTEDGQDGHLVGISSVAAHAGSRRVPAYHASKAFVSTYLQGLRLRQSSRDTDVVITTIEPGFVDTRLSYSDFWECSPETAACQIIRAIEKGRSHVYVTRRWRVIGWLLDLLPESLLRRLRV